MYNCLPMYHSAGGILAVGAVLAGGGSVVIGRRFSARRFWEEIVGWDCTLFQYIGELCRYLVNSAPHPSETDHRLRLCCGNGLRGDVWTCSRTVSAFRRSSVLRRPKATSLWRTSKACGAIGRIPCFRPSIPRRWSCTADRRAGARRARLLRALRAARGRRSHRPVGKGSVERRQLVRGLNRQGGVATASPARRLRARRRLVPDGRPDAPRRAGLLLLRRPHRRHVPVERGERRHQRSRRRDLPVSWHHRGRGLRRPDSRRRRSRRHGRRRDQRRSIRPRSAPTSSPRCRTARARCSCALRDGRGDVDVQATTTTALHAGQRPDRIADALYADDGERQAYVRLDTSLYDRIQSGLLPGVHHHARA